MTLQKVLKNMATALQKNLKYLMERKGIAVTDLERKAGLNVNSIRHIVSGASLNPNITTLNAIANTLGVTIDQLTNEDAIVRHTITNHEQRVFLMEVATEVVKELKSKGDIEIHTLQKVIEDVYLYAIRGDHPYKVESRFVSWTIDKLIK